MYINFIIEMFDINIKDESISPIYFINVYKIFLKISFTNLNYMCSSDSIT